MKEKIQPTEGIFLHITHTKNGDIITNDFTSFAGLSHEQIIELIETDNQVYKMEIARRKAIRRAKERNRVKIAMIRFIKSL